CSIISHSFHYHCLYHIHSLFCVAQDCCSLPQVNAHCCRFSCPHPRSPGYCFSSPDKTFNMLNFCCRISQHSSSQKYSTRFPIRLVACQALPSTPGLSGWWHCLWP
ncbi:hypothetical protein S83_062940, partial [Arachis hypogaea]